MPHARGHASPAMSPARPARVGCCVERTSRRATTAPSQGVHQPGRRSAETTTATIDTSVAVAIADQRRARTRYAASAAEPTTKSCGLTSTAMAHHAPARRARRWARSRYVAIQYAWSRYAHWPWGHTRIAGQHPVRATDPA